MLYNSTRDNAQSVEAAYAIAHGISKEGGLFVPQTVPTLTKEDFLALKNMSYVERAKYILVLFLTDFSE